MADIAIFRINYKSDFIITLESDAGWATPFCIKFWTDSPQRAFYVQYDGETYTHCAPVAGEPTKLTVQMDDHHLGIGNLQYQIAYHFTVADFPNDTEDEVLNQAAVIINEDGQQEQVMLDLNGETAPEIAFSLPAYANEQQRIANEQQRIANETQRIANEEQRIAAEQTRQQNEQQRIANEEARVAEFARLKRESEQATEDANDAAVLATTAADLATAKAQLAQDAATLANQKAQLAADKAALADAAADLATAKAQLAQEKATYAQTQGDYAKAQGDYAKAEGDAIKALNTQMTANEQTRQQNEQARQAAEQQRVTEFEQQMASQQYAYEQAEANRESAFETAEEARDAKVDEKVADITQLRTDLDTFEQEVDNDYARKDGFYETMGVGTAVNLAGQTERTDDAMYRKSGGSEEVATGLATIANIKGKTVAWNQLVGASTNSVTTISGHVYYTNIGGVESLVTGDGSDIAVTGGTDMVIDLTLVYNNTNVATTVAIFKADYFKWFGKPLTYEDYDAGSLRSVQLDAMKTTGFNQWDEEWESAYLIPDGRVFPGNETICSKNFIKILPDCQYYAKMENKGGRICFYDSNKSFLSTLLHSNGLFTTPHSAYFMKFDTKSLYGATYNHDICINISDTSKNGTYEPYEEHVASLPVTTLKGKLNGEGESVTIFPDGMKSAGTVYDEIYTVGDKTYAVVRVGSVDLGTLNWSYRDTYKRFTTKLPSYKQSNIPNLISPLYRGTAAGYFDTYMSEDKLMCDDNKPTGINIYFRNLSYTDAATFKNAMNGVILYYELKTPLVYEVDDFALPKRYLVDGGGTEEQVQKANVQGIAAILTCIYGVDAVGILNKLPKNYISEKSMDNFLAQLNTATGGVWSKTFNENSGEWDFSFQSSQVEPENTTNQEEA